MESKEDQADGLGQEITDSGIRLQKSVANTIVPADAGAQRTLADTVTPACSASNQDIAKRAVVSRLEALYGMRPKYLRYNVWGGEETDEGKGNNELSCLADWTEHAQPLPGVPDFERENREAMKTIETRPDLFKIIMPINVDRFEELLTTHPNCPFMESVCRGLREGFWPWANTRHDEYPSIVDKSLGMPEKQEEADFLHADTL
jgi:hypothetical protein